MARITRKHGEKGAMPKKGIGSGLEIARDIKTERPPKEHAGRGTPHTYFGNSRDIDTKEPKHHKGEGE